MTPTQFKEKTRNFAAEKHLNPQIVQRYYMMEKLLECIVESPYHDDFVLKYPEEIIFRSIFFLPDSKDFVFLNIL